MELLAGIALLSLVLSGLVCMVSPKAGWKIFLYTILGVLAFTFLSWALKNVTATIGEATNVRLTPTELVTGIVVGLLLLGALRFFWRYMLKAKTLFGERAKEVPPTPKSRLSLPMRLASRPMQRSSYE